MRFLVRLNLMANVLLAIAVVVFAALLYGDGFIVPVIEMLFSKDYLAHWLLNSVVLCAMVAPGIITLRRQKRMMRRSTFDPGASDSKGIKWMIAAVPAVLVVGFFTFFFMFDASDATVLSWGLVLFAILASMMLIGGAYMYRPPKRKFVRLAQARKALLGMPRYSFEHQPLLYACLSGFVGGVLVAVASVPKISSSRVDLWLVWIVIVAGVLALVKAVYYMGAWLGRSK